MSEQNNIITPGTGETGELVRITELTKIYGKKTALSNVNLTLEPGRIVGLLGPNGSGKTTLMKIMTGAIRDFTGSVTVNGKEIGPETRAYRYLPEPISQLMDATLDMIAFSAFLPEFDEQKSAKCEAAGPERKTED
jgi:ABC-2 type transport system ATP-binding protein